MARKKIMTAVGDGMERAGARPSSLSNMTGRSSSTGRPMRCSSSTWCSTTLPMPPKSGHAPAVRGARAVGAGYPLAALAPHAAYLRSGEPQAHLLSFPGVPDRPVTGQQHPQPAPRSRCPAYHRRTQARLDGHRSRRNPTPASAMAAWAASRRAFSIRWPRCSSRRWATGCATSTAFSARPSRTAGNASIRTIGCGTPIPGRLPGRRRRLNSSSAARSRCTREPCARSSASRRPCWAFRTIARSWVTAAEPSIRCGYGPPPRLMSSIFKAFSTGAFVTALAQRLAAELDHSGSLSRRFDDPGARSALRAGVFPGRLLAGGSRAALPAAQCRLEYAAGQGRDPAQRYPSQPGRPGADADPARRSRPWMGPGLGYHQAHACLYQPHPAARGFGKMAAEVVRADAAAPSGDHSGHQPAPPGRGADALPGRGGPRQAGKPRRGRR